MQKPKLAPFALSLGMLWLAAGALFKLFEGSPNDLPQKVLEYSPLGALETLRAAVIIELAVIGLVIARPRVGWVFLAGTFATFIAVLVPLVQEGASSCGCFGGNIEIDPRWMLGIDGGLLLLLLVSAPWRMSRDSGLGMPAFVPFAVVAVLAPWQKIQPASTPNLDPDRKQQLVEELRARGGALGTTTEQEASPAGGDPAATAPAADGSTRTAGAQPAENPPAEVATADAGTEPVTAEPAVEPPAGPGLPEFYAFEPLDPDQGWVGKDFYATDIADFYLKGFDLGLEQGAVNPNSHVIIYRQTCEVCAEHLQEIWQEVANADAKWLGKSLVLLRIREAKDATSQNLCTVLPETNAGAGILVEKVQIPELKRGYGITTPYTFDVDESGLVQNPVDLRTELGH